MEIKSVKPKVTLLRYTPEPEKTVALAAKLCYSDLDIDRLKNDIDLKDTSKFINMLIKMGHLSPIEHASFTFSIEGVSRAFLAQVTRHRIASFSVKSQRYVGADKTFNYIIPPAIEALGQDAVDEYNDQMRQIHNWYVAWQQRLGEGEASNEDARFVLPNAAETKLIMTMNARELMHFFGLRCCNRAQWEIREVAWRMLEEAIKVAPNLFKNSGPSCVYGVCSEGKMTCGKAAQVKERHKKLFDPEV
ncbi:MAG TPA: FAD-dependent thymidylate synthase [Clostridia bacterium]|jgi:thymidylate synthase (FAD)